MVKQYPPSQRLDVLNRASSNRSAAIVVADCESRKPSWAQNDDRPTDHVAIQLLPGRWVIFHTNTRANDNQLYELHLSLSGSPLKLIVYKTQKHKGSVAFDSRSNHGDKATAEYWANYIVGYLDDHWRPLNKDEKNEVRHAQREASKQEGNRGNFFDR